MLSAGTMQVGMLEDKNENENEIVGICPMVGTLNYSGIGLVLRSWNCPPLLSSFHSALDGPLTSNHPSVPSSLVSGSLHRARYICRHPICHVSELGVLIQTAPRHSTALTYSLHSSANHFLTDMRKLDETP